MAKAPPVLGGRSKVQRGRDYEKRRRAAKPWRAWYGLPVWQQIRDEQLEKQPLCERCDRDGIVRAATVVNHRKPHRGDWDRFVAGPFESVCKPHHDGEVQREERAAARQAQIGGSAGRSGGVSKG
jgi:5-methylcytosine-specific restriction enzyme A